MLDEDTENFVWVLFYRRKLFLHVIDCFDLTAMNVILCSLDNNESLVNYQVLPKDVLECRVGHVIVT